MSLAEELERLSGENGAKKELSEFSFSSAFSGKNERKIGIDDCCLR